jgi:hypothetical protein
MYPNIAGLQLKHEIDRILKKEGLDGYRISKKVSSFCPLNHKFRKIYPV